MFSTAFDNAVSFEELRQEISEALAGFPGSVSFLYRELAGKDGAAESSVPAGEREIAYRTELVLPSASVIKLPILVTVFQDVEEGRRSLEDSYVLRDEDRVPSCGCLNRMHAGLTVTVADLCNLMIILSDNAATNILIRMIGIDRVNEVMSDLGFKDCHLNRLLFDWQAQERGLENLVSARDIGRMLTQIWQGTLVSEAASAAMLDILTEQRLNGKIPFFFEERVPIAHKTGEDEGITHDVGIILGERPFLLCIMGAETCVPALERFMQDAAWALYRLTEAGG